MHLCLQLSSLFQVVRVLYHLLARTLSLNIHLFSDLFLGCLLDQRQIQCLNWTLPYLKPYVFHELPFPFGSTCQECSLFYVSYSSDME